MRRLLLFTLCIFFWGKILGQTVCTDPQSELVIEIKTDHYGYETSWMLKDITGFTYAFAHYASYDNRTLYRDTVCLPAGACLNFTIYDSFGDGIEAPGYYRLILDGTIIKEGGSFTNSESFDFQCIPGEVCKNTIPVLPGQYTTYLEDTWYQFTPDITGIYRISTCGLSNCDTKIWVYDTCEGITVSEDNRSTILFNDDENPCAPLADLSGYLEKDKTYFIRIGDKENACTDSIVWELAFEGPVKGCTNPQSCNFNPLATIDDGSCLPQGHYKCPAGPDLRVRQDSLVRSIRLDTIHANDYCLIQEGCLRGYGVRQILRFTTVIENIGERDYYIGKPGYDNPQFSWNNCHNHFHYDSYAEYVLYREDGSEYPIGFKNGFCITDFGCPPGITPKYSCNNMGISAGCYDTYWADLQCQWIDLTDVPDGRYTFVTRVNWKNNADALGQLEMDTTNNWAQACIILDRSSGKLKVTVDENCQTYTDCMGAPYGNALPDCAGICNGEGIMGDVDQNGAQSMNDAHRYITLLLGNDLEPSSCSDLSGDGKISVYDAALLSSCLNYGATHQHQGAGTHNHCKFPAGITNIHDTVWLQIADVNWEQQYVDIGIRNPGVSVNAYQFKLNGLLISHVENLVNPDIYPIAPRTSMNDGMIVGISYQDSVITKSQYLQPLCRVHFLKTTSDSVCITQIMDIVNGNHERIIALTENACALLQPTAITDLPRLKQVKVFPNPFREETIISFYNPDSQFFQLEIMDINGRILQQHSAITGREIRVTRGNLPPGIYFFRLWGARGYATGKLILD